MYTTNCLCSILFWDKFLDLYTRIYGNMSSRERFKYIFSAASFGKKVAVLDYVDPSPRGNKLLIVLSHMYMYKVIILLLALLVDIITYVHVLK